MASRRSVSPDSEFPRVPQLVTTWNGQLHIPDNAALPPSWR